jgi:hypothetical protein
MESIILSAGRMPQQRTTLYGRVLPAQVAASFRAGALLPVVTLPGSSKALV